MYEKFCRNMESENQRLADENRRQNRHIAVLKDNVRQSSVPVKGTNRKKLTK